jgi:uncharacterized protein (TIGR02594 family)
VTAEGLIRSARSYVGHRETKRNSSPLIDHWLQSVGQPPGEPWCAAFVCACVLETEPNLGFLKSASALKLITRNPDRVISDPEPGALAIWDHGKGKGHVGIVTTVLWTPQEFSAISGNTDDKNSKSREGVMVAEHAGYSSTDPMIAGFLRVCTPLRATA